MAGDALQKFKSSLNRGVTSVSVKAMSSLEKSKLKTHIESIEAEIQKLTASVGEAAYQSWASGEKDFGRLEEQCALIQQKREEVSRLVAELSSIDERDSQIFGNKTEEAAGIVCPSCGSRYETPVRFCRKCGQQLTE